jgi:hypothetical protein
MSLHDKHPQEPMEPRDNGGVTDRAKDRELARQRRKLAEVFGEILPETTRDERTDDAEGAGDSERWYRENRPPHHERG